MNTFARRTTGQPSYNGLTETQFRFFLSGVLLCCAAAGAAIYVKAMIGLPIIAVTAFCLGYFCTKQETLNTVSRQFDESEHSLLLIVIMQVFLYAIMLVAYAPMTDFSSPLGTAYTPVALATAHFTYLGCSQLGRIIRARWNGIRI